MHAFNYNGLPSRIVFGAGAIERLPEELAKLGIKRPLLVSTPEQYDSVSALQQLLSEPPAGIFAEAMMHTPVDVTLRGVAHARDTGADGLVALGGGSTTGLSKGIALRTGMPQIILPTTYAGSEVTPILGETQSGQKTTQRTDRVLPATVIYDVNLTLSLPAGLSGVSGLNAIAHAVEALYALDRNPIVSLMAEEGIRALAHALPKIVANPGDEGARSDALYGAWLCGVCLGSVGMALHHKLCHTLGGSFNLPHAETHSIILPHAVAYNAAAAPEAMGRIARALGTADAVDGLYDLLLRLGAIHSLRDLGMPESGINVATEVALTNPYWNPRQLTRQGLRALIASAWAGERPQSNG